MIKKNVISPGLRKLYTYSPLQCQSCQDYLEYSKAKKLNISSTVFRGTLYELLCKKHLLNTFNAFNLQRKGGAGDQGIDIHGNWNLASFLPNSETIGSIASTRSQFGRIEPIMRKSREYDALRKLNTKSKKSSLASDINILVQCKNHDSKIGVKTIRELAGIYHSHFHEISEIQRTFMFLYSPRIMTSHASRLADSLNIPLIHVRLSELKFNNGDLFNLKNWHGGKMESYYMNFMSRSLLNGLNLETQLMLHKIK